MLEKLRTRPAEATDKVEPLNCSTHPELERWIIRHCRKGWDAPTGYIAQMYEVWTAGKLIVYVRNKFRLKKLIFSGYRRENQRNISKHPFVAEEEEEEATIRRLSQITEPAVNPKMNKFINKSSVRYAEERRKSMEAHFVNLQAEILTAKKKGHRKSRKRQLSSSIHQSGINRKQ